MTLRVLVVGDPYMPVSAYAEALASLNGAGPNRRFELSTMQIDQVTCASPVTESERRLREYVGDPAEVARAVAGHDALIVHGGRPRDPGRVAYVLPQPALGLRDRRSARDLVDLHRGQLNQTVQASQGLGVRGYRHVGVADDQDAQGHGYT